MRPGEKTFERLLGAALRKRLDDAGSDCPSPDLLAAAFDAALAPGEARQWNTHVAGCARCQERMTLLVRASDPPAVRLGLRARVARAVEHRREVGGWKWLAAPAVAAAALALVFRGGVPKLPSEPRHAAPPPAASAPLKTERKDATDEPQPRPRGAPPAGEAASVRGSRSMAAMRAPETEAAAPLPAAPPVAAPGAFDELRGAAVPSTIVIERPTELRAAPRPDAALVGVAPAGARAEVVAVQHDWTRFRLQLEGGRRLDGWAPSRSLAR